MAEIGELKGKNEESKKGKGCNQEKVETTSDNLLTLVYSAKFF